LTVYTKFLTPSDYQKPEDRDWQHGLLKQLTKAVIERALHA